MRRVKLVKTIQYINGEYVELWEDEAVAGISSESADQDAGTKTANLTD